jgi:hypothetical protein
MKNCTKCKNALWNRTKTGRLSPSGDGLCTVVVKMPTLPTSMHWGWSFDTPPPEPNGGYINRREELREHCHCYEEIKK